MQGTSWMLTVLLVPTLAAIWLAHESGTAETLVEARTVLVACGALISAGLLLVHARLAGNEHSQWFGTALAVFAVLGLVRGGYSLTHPVSIPAHAATILGGTLALVAVLGVLALIADRRPSWMHPLAVGIPLVVVSLTVQHVALAGRPRMSIPSAPALSLVLCGVVTLLALIVHRLDALPRWARDRLSAAVLVSGLSATVLLGSVPLDSELRAVVSLAGGMAGAVLFTTTSAALLREVMTEPQRQVADLHRRLASAEEDRRADSARMHDVNSLVAGIASAFGLIRELPPSDCRDGLEAMVTTELDRLQRLLAVQGRGPARGGVVQEVVLDEVLGRVALSHRSRGRRVAETRTDLRVLGDADDLAQLLDILVDNAARHGTPDDITLSARRTDSYVEVVVSDGGPGVPTALRESLFAWGVRGPDSEGSGIGLCTAKLLAERLGGQLRLDPAASGASFVVSLPAARASTQPSSEDLAVA